MICLWTRLAKSFSPTRSFRPPSNCRGRDSADRFLAATAQVMDLTRITSDDHLLTLGNHTHY